MEVHAHTHTPRKKWTHYFWEFFMLFLAVTLGFFVENQREHFVEHQREKQFMISLIEDLETDKAELKRGISQTDSTIQYADSALIFLTSYKPSAEIPFRFSDLIIVAGQRLSLINTDRTSSQLKNSGAMRLIRNSKVVNGILQYWKQIDKTNITLERYLIYRNAGRELSFKLFIVPPVYVHGLGIQQDSIRSLRVIDRDSKKWDELANLIAVSQLVLSGARLTSGSHLNNLNRQYAMAVNLIALIKKEYHLK